jgi:t-SNARE complex subunit (syntaxin)
VGSSGRLAAVTCVLNEQERPPLTVACRRYLWTVVLVQDTKQLAVSQHILIVRPDPTEEKILETTSEGADTRIFQQALMNSDRRG